MGCRVGMTTDPESRKAEWKKKYPNLYGWEILHRTRSKSHAQQLETQEATARGCDHGSGGGGPETGDWHVYYFRF